MHVGTGWGLEPPSTLWESNNVTFTPSAGPKLQFLCKVSAILQNLCYLIFMGFHSILFIAITPVNGTSCTVFGLS